MPEISISEENGLRYLHFGTPWIQGGMRIKSPTSLALDYSKQMMAIWLLSPTPQKIVQLGIGAGSIAKFCLHHRFAPELVAVDIDAAVIQIAHTLFALPKPGAGFQTVEMDALVYLQGHQTTQCDWLQVDLYDQHARGPIHGNLAFYQICAKSLSPTGWAAFNLFGRHDSYAPNLLALRQSFNQVYTLPRLPEGNIIALASHQVTELPPLETLQQRATQLFAQTGLNLRQWVAVPWDRP